MLLPISLSLGITQRRPDSNSPTLNSKLPERLATLDRPGPKDGLCDGGARSPVARWWALNYGPWMLRKKPPACWARPITWGCCLYAQCPVSLPPPRGLLNCHRKKRAWFASQPAIPWQERIKGKCNSWEENGLENSGMTIDCEIWNPISRYFSY